MKNIRRFTLVELLAVMALIAILSGIGFGAYSYSQNKAKESATASLLAQLDAGLNGFHAKNKYFPNSGGEFKPVKFTIAADGTVTEIDFGSDKLTYDSSASTAKDRKKNELFEAFTKSVADMQTIKNNLDKDGYVVDAWGGRIYYCSPGKFKTGSYDIISAGRDGVFGKSEATTPGASLNDFRENTGEHLCDDIFTF